VITYLIAGAGEDLDELVTLPGITPSLPTFAKVMRSMLAATPASVNVSSPGLTDSRCSHPA
jgi:hypothetical protein